MSLRGWLPIHEDSRLLNIAPAVKVWYDGYFFIEVYKDKVDKSNKANKANKSYKTYIYKIGRGTV